MIAGIFLSIVNVAGGILGYAFQSIMGRLLLPVEYGQLTTIVSLGVFLGSPVAALIMMTARTVADDGARGRYTDLLHKYFALLKKVGCIAFVFILISILLIHDVETPLNLQNSTPLYLFLIYLFFWLLCSINFAYFQGLSEFSGLAFLELFGIALKILFSSFFVYLGLGVEGAVFGMGVAACINYFVGSSILFRKHKLKKISKIIYSNELKKSSPIMIILAAVGFSALTQLDVVYASMYFSPSEVGQFAALSVLGKAIFYLPGGFAMAIFPAVVRNEIEGKSSILQLAKVLVFSSIMCLFGAIIYLIFGDLIVKIFYGPSFSEAGNLLGYYGLAVIPLGLIMLGEQFLIAKGRTLFTWIFLVVAPLQYLAIRIWHDKLSDLIWIIGISGLVILLLGYGALVYEYISKDDTQVT